MSARSTWLPAFALIAFVICCGGSNAGPEATSTSGPTGSTEPSPSVTAAVTAERQPTSPPNVTSSNCSNPYVDGGRGESTPSQSNRLHPTGTAPPIGQFQPIAMSEDAALDRVVRDSIGPESMHFAVVVKRLDNGSGVSIDAGRLFYPASLFKAWVMIEAYHQRDVSLLDFGERYVVSDYYAGLRLNDGELAPCSEVTADQALHAMIQLSDNVAANLLYDRVGYTNVNNTLRQLGLAFSGLETGGDLQTTAGGMATVFEAIGRGKAITPGASQEMVALLEGDTINDRIPALLPPGTPVAHKTGNWDNATHDVGIVYSPNANYVIAVLTDYGYADGGASRIARLSKAVYDYYNPAG